MCFPVRWSILGTINVRLMFKERIPSDFVLDFNLFPQILLENHKNSLIFLWFCCYSLDFRLYIVNEN